MKKVADVQLSNDRTAKVYYGWQREPDDTSVTMRIEAVTPNADAGLSPTDQITLLDAVKRAVTSR